MEPKGHLFSFKCGGAARGRTFYLRAVTFQAACDKAEIWIQVNLDATCWLKSITQVADACDLVD